MFLPYNVTTHCILEVIKSPIWRTKPCSISELVALSGDSYRPWLQNKSTLKPICNFWQLQMKQLYNWMSQLYLQASFIVGNPTLCTYFIILLAHDTKLEQGDQVVGRNMAMGDSTICYALTKTGHLDWGCSASVAVCMMLISSQRN